MIFSIKKGYNYIRNVVPIEKRNKHLVFMFILLGLTMDNLNIAATYTSTISIQEKFQTSSTITSWVLSAYSLTLGSFILVFGKLSDIMGPHNVFLIGLTMIWVCSLITAVIEKSIIALIIFRAFQGIGASALVPSGFAIAANYYNDNPKHLSRAISFLICALTSSFGFGTILGGAFSQTSIGYKSLYYFIFALTLVINVILILIILPIEKTNEHKNLKISNLNFPGVFLFVTGSLLMILGLTEGGNNWLSPTAYIPLPLGFLVAFSVFIFESVYIRNFQVKNKNIDNETLSKYGQWKLKLDLLFPPECLKIPNFLVFLACIALYYMTFTVCIIGQIQYHLYVEGDSPLLTACKVLPLSVGLVLSSSYYTKERYDRIGARLLLTLSPLIALGSYVWITRLKYDIPNAYWKFEFGGMFMFGIGTNIFFNIYMNVVLPNTPLHLQGVVSGIYQTFSQVPLCLANAIIASIMGSMEVAQTPQQKYLLSNRFETIQYVGMGFMAFAFFIILFAKNIHMGKIQEVVEKQTLDTEADSQYKTDSE